MSGQNHRTATLNTLPVSVHLLLLCAPVFWAGNFIVGRALRGDVPPVSLNFWRWKVAVLVGLVALAPVYAWRVASGERMAFTASSIAGMLYVGLFASVLAFTFWSKGIAQVGPGRAGVYMHVMPVAGTILAVTLLGETLAPFHLLGGALVFLGIALTNWQTAGSRRGSKMPPWGRNLYKEMTRRG